MAKIPKEVARAAIGADCFRFPESADFDQLKYPALTVEELAALSCSRDPKVLNAKRIAEFRLMIPHPALARTRQDLMDFSALARAFEQRRDFLLRACRHGDLQGTSVGDTYEVRPADFFPWLDRQGGKAPWDVLPDEFEERGKAFRVAQKDGRAAVSTAPPARGTPGKKASAARKSASAVLDSLKDRSGKPIKGKTGVIEAWKLMCEVITTPHEKRKHKYPTMGELREYCERKFEIAQNDSDILARAANKLPCAIQYLRGNPGKSKAA